MKKVLLLITSLVLLLSAEQIMKVTFKDGSQEHAVSTISKIVFTESTMSTGASGSYNLDAIERIEFYDDGTAIINKGSGDAAQGAVAKGKVSFTHTVGTLSLALPKAGELSVTMYSIQGRKVATLYSGALSSNRIAFDLKQQQCATGIYSVVVKYDGSYFVRKIVIQ